MQIRRSKNKFNLVIQTSNCDMSIWFRGTLWYISDHHFKNKNKIIHEMKRQFQWTNIIKNKLWKKIPNIIRVRGVFEIKATSKQYWANETAINNLYAYLSMYIEHTRAHLTRWHLKNNKKCSVLGTCNETAIFFRNADNAPSQDKNVDLPTYTRITTLWLSQHHGWKI